MQVYLKWRVFSCPITSLKRDFLDRSCYIESTQRDLLNLTDAKICASGADETSHTLIVPGTIRERFCWCAECGNCSVARARHCIIRHGLHKTCEHSPIHQIKNWIMSHSRFKSI